MNNITELLNLEDSDISFSDISIQGTTKTLTLETKLYAHYCPSYGYRMYSRGVKKRTIKHPILSVYDVLNPPSPYHPTNPRSSEPDQYPLHTLTVFSSRPNVLRYMQKIYSYHPDNTLLPLKSNLYILVISLSDRVS